MAVSVETRSLIPADIVNIQDPVTWLDEPVRFALHRSGEQLTYYPQLTSNTSQSNTTFEVSVPSMSTITDRAICLQMPITIDFTGTAPLGQNLLQTGFDAFRAWPLQSVMSTLTIEINGCAYSQDQSKIVPYMTRINGFNQFTEFSLSTTPHYMDPAQTYDQLVNTNRNPLGGYAEAPDGTNTARGAFPFNVVTNNNTTAQITATLIEPLMISPLTWGDILKKGLCGADRFVIKINWSTNLSRVWSHSNAGGSVFTVAPQVTFGQPQLNLRYVMPQRMYRQPRAFLYGFDSFRVYSTSTNTLLAAGASQQFSLQNIQLGVVPDTIVVFARKRDSDLTYLDPDVFAGITGVNITYGTLNGILASATQSDLYQIARKNMVALSWESWSGQPINVMLGASNSTIAGAGSILPLKVGIDIPVAAESSSGVIENVQITITLTIRNPSPNAVNYDIYALVIDKGTWSIMDKTAVTQTGIISAVAAVQARTENPTIVYSSAYAQMTGGSFLGDIWGGIKKVGEFIAKDAIPFVRDVALPIGSMVPGVGKFASALMRGRGFDERSQASYHPDEDLDDLRSIHSYRSDDSRGTMSGGKLISAGRLRQRLDRV